MDDIKQMAVKLSMLIDSFERRGDQVDRVVAQAMQSITQTSRNSDAVAELATSCALQQFRQAAAAQLSEGLHDPIELATGTLQNSMRKLHALINACELRQTELNRTHKRDAWKVFVASTLTSLVMLGGSVYAIADARKESAKARWTSDVSAVIAAGKLTSCVDGGLCVYVNKQWFRLDRSETLNVPVRKSK